MNRIQHARMKQRVNQRNKQKESKKNKWLLKKLWIFILVLIILAMIFWNFANLIGLNMADFYLTLGMEMYGLALAIISIEIIALGLRPTYVEARRLIIKKIINVFRKPA